MILMEDEVLRRVRNYLQKMEDTQADVSRRLGVGKSFINRILRGTQDAPAWLLAEVGVRKVWIKQYETK